MPEDSLGLWQEGKSQGSLALWQERKSQDGHEGKGERGKEKLSLMPFRTRSREVWSSGKG